MKRLAGVGLTCLLASCVTSPAGLHQAEPAIVSEFPAVAAELSDCVYRVMNDMGSPYTFRLHARPDQLEFYITATQVSDAITKRQRAGLELRFIAQGQATSVEIREGVPDGWVLTRQVQPIIERCSHQLAPSPAATPIAPSPFPLNSVQQ